MKKLFKFILFLVFMYALFVTIDCVRLKNSDEFTKPLLVFNEEVTKEEMNYQGLGYKVTYKVKRVKQTYDLEVISASEGNFVLFDTFTLWTKKYSNN